MPLNLLPHELLLEIGSYLDEPSLFYLSLTSRHLTAPAASILPVRAATYVPKKGNSGALALWLAISSRNSSVVTSLLAGPIGLYCRITDPFYKALHMVTIMRYKATSMRTADSPPPETETARSLIAAFPHVIVRGSVSFGCDTPLHDAAGAGNLPMVARLLDLGHPRDVLNLRHQSAFQTALLARHAHVAAYLVQRGIALKTPAATFFVRKSSAVHDAVEMGFVDVFEMVLERTDDVDVVDARGRTVLHCAVEAGNVRMVAMLTERGADVRRVTGETGETPWAIAVRKGNEEVLEVLVKAGAGKGRAVDGSGDVVGQGRYRRYTH